MTRRRAVLAAAGAFFAAPLAVLGQSGKSIRVGFLGHGFAPSLWDALVGALREAGYVEGRNLTIERRFSGNDNARLEGFAIELVQAKVDIIVTEGTPASLAAKRATSTIPIVVAVSGDIVASGLVPSLAHPGGNITGITILSGELMSKRLELMKLALPGVKRVGVMLNPTNPVQAVSWDAAQATAESLKFNVRRYDVRSQKDFEPAFARMVAERIDGLALAQDGLLLSTGKAIAGLALRHGIPSIGYGDYADLGGLIGYGVDNVEAHRRAAYFIDRIAQGAKPGDLPVEQPTGVYLVINHRTAKALKVTIPSDILFRANRSIE